MKAIDQEAILSGLRRKGYVVDVRNRASIVVMQGKRPVGMYPTLDDAIEAAVADYDWTQREYDVNPL